MTQTTASTNEQATNPVQRLRITSRKLQTSAQFKPNAASAAAIGAAAHAPDSSRRRALGEGGEES
jgi:hypothetical protein